jgi:hypothetical protein
LYRNHGFFFCSPCALYHTVVEKWKVDSEGHRYKCVAGHTDFIFPTTKVKTYYPSRQLYSRGAAVQPVESDKSDEDSSSEDEDESSVDEMMDEIRERENLFSPFAHTQRILDFQQSPDPIFLHPINPEVIPYPPQEIAMLRAEVERLKESELKKERNKKERSKKQNVTNQEDNPPQIEKKKRQTKNVVNANLVQQLTEAIRDVLTKVPQFKNLGGKRVTNAFTSVF